MAKDPCVLFYFNDFHGGTVTMTRHQKGCYIDLLHAQFNSSDCALSLDEIKSILHQDFETTWLVLKKKFKEVEGGMYQNERLLFEKERRSKFSKSRRDNALSKSAEIPEEEVYRKFAHLSMSKEQFNNLLSLGYNISQINNVMDSIFNYKKNTNYVSLFLTAKKWLQKEHGQGKASGTVNANKEAKDILNSKLKTKW